MVRVKSNDPGDIRYARKGGIITAVFPCATFGVGINHWIKQGSSGYIYWL